MDDDAVDVEIVITRKPEPEREFFVCEICEKAKEVTRPRWRYEASEKPPICRQCIHSYGSKCSGPVFNRRNYQTLKELSAITAALQWEIRNGKYQRHR